MSSCAARTRVAADGPASPADSAEKPAAAEKPTAYDLIFRGGRVVDGTGNGWFYADVAVQNGRIARVGDLRGEKARREIDARGLAISPGFIDVHTHCDDDLLHLPYADNFLRDGVTTVVSGNCGSSVEDIGAYFRDLASTGTAINAATLVGHNTVLEKVKGDKADPLTPPQIEACKAFIHKAMLDGALGMSTGLIYSPGKYSTTEEIIELQKAAAEMGGIYTSHMRSESGAILEAVDEALRIGREAHCRVEISHLKIPADNRIGGSETVLKKIRAARDGGFEVWADQYPYTASSSGITTLMPDWLMEQGSAEAKKRIKDPAEREKIFATMKQDHEIARRRKDLGFAVIASSRAYPKIDGKSILEVARILKWGRMNPEKKLDWNALPPAAEWPEVSMLDQYETILDIYLKGGASCVFHTQDEKDVMNFMRCPFVGVVSDSGVRKFGSGKPHPRGYGSNARVLGRYVREKHNITLEDAVRKMTSLPALAFRFRDRGMVREGYWADLTLFDPETVEDLSTFEDPHHYSKGIEYVMVNGELVLERGNLTGKRPGRGLRGPAYSAPDVW